MSPAIHSAGKNSLAGAVLERQAQRAGAKRRGSGRRANRVKHQRQALTVARRRAFDVEKLRRVRDRVEHDDKPRRQGQRHDGLVAGRQFERFERHRIEQSPDLVRQIDARAPEDLTQILRGREGVRLVCRDPAHPRTDRERHLDHLVQRGLVTGRTQRAVVLRPVDAFERGAGVEHPAAAGTQHVPRQFEKADTGRVQERAEGPFLVDPFPGGEGEDVDPAELAVGPAFNQPLDGVHRDRIGGLPQHGPHRLGFAHGQNLRQKPRISSAAVLAHLTSLRALAGLIPLSGATHLGRPSARRKVGDG